MASHRENETANSTSATTLQDGYPTVTRGANDQSVHIDWLRFSSDLSNLDLIIEYLFDQFGMPTSGKGLYGKPTGLHWKEGLRIAHDISDAMNPGIVVEVPGGFLSAWTFDEVLQFATFFAQLQGTRCTRIDIAVDWRGDHINLIEEVQAACQRGELCGAKKHSLNVTQLKDVHSEKTLTIGRRGKDGSGRFLRIYDKGLQTGQANEARWVRWEVEFSNPISECVLMTLLDNNDARNEARKLALGAVEFRLPGNRKRDRPVSQWWKMWLDSVEPFKLTSPRLTPDLDRKLHWYRTCVLPGLKQVAGEFNLSPGQLLDALGKDNVGDQQSPYLDPAIHQLRALLKSHTDPTPSL